MPTWGWRSAPWRRRYCDRAYTWSTMRGGCRFEPNHAGPCKPGRLLGGGI